MAGLDPADQVLREIEEFGNRQFIPVIGPKKGKILTDVITEHKPRMVLEVGTFIGYSAILMAKHLPSDARVTSIEIDGATAQTAQRNIARAGFSDKIRVIVGDAKAVIPTLKEEFDLAFLDAGKEEYITYLRLVESQLHSGSVVVADNAGIFAHELAAYLHHVRNSGKYKSHYCASTLEFRDNIPDGVEVSIKL